mgnify:CR=1 FL=1
MPLSHAFNVVCPCCLRQSRVTGKRELEDERCKSCGMRLFLDLEKNVEEKSSQSKQQEYATHPQKYLDAVFKVNGSSPTFSTPPLQRDLGGDVRGPVLVGEVPGKEREFTGYREDFFDEYLPKRDAAFEARIASVMSDNRYDRRVPSQRGKLDPARLWKVRAASTRVFRDKQEQKNKQYAVVIAIDRSGSMNDEKKEYNACATAMAACDALQTAQIPFAIVSYACAIRTEKPFAKPWREVRGDLPRNLITTNDHRDNRDWDALVHSYSLLHGERGAKKILLVFSDGRPFCAGSCYEPLDVEKRTGLTEKQWDDLARARRQTDAVRRVVLANPDVTTVGVGIQTDVSDIYPHNIRVDDLSEFRAKVVGQLREIIKR